MDALPATENLTAAVNAALELAASGAPGLGYRLLDLTLARLERKRDAVPPELLEQYRLALVLFARAHGIWFQLPANADSFAPPTQWETGVDELRKLRGAARDNREHASLVRERARETVGNCAARRSRWQESFTGRRLELLTAG